MESFDSKFSSEEQSEYMDKSVEKPVVKMKKHIAKDDRNNTITKEDFIPAHIQAKLEMEERRKKFQENWLFPEHSNDGFLDSNIFFDSHQIKGSVTNNLLKKSVAQQHKSDSNAKKTAPGKKNTDSYKTELVDECNSESLHVNSFVEDVNWNTPNGDMKDENIYNDAQGEILLVTKIDINKKSKQVFLQIENHLLKEMDLVSPKIIDCLDLRSLTSLETERKDKQCTLHLNFHSANSSRQSRHYVIESEEKLNEFLSTCEQFKVQNLTENNDINIFQCLKCSELFPEQTAAHKVMTTKTPSSSVELSIKTNKKDYIKEINVCPKCGSSVIIVSDEQMVDTKKNKALSEISPESCSNVPISSDEETPNKLEDMDSTTFQDFQECEELEIINVIDLLDEKETYSLENFTVLIDSRHKLHLECNVFSNDEHLEAYLEVSVVIFPTCELFNGVLAISNKFIRVMKIFDNADSFEKNMKQFDKLPLTDFEEINILLGNQGFFIKSSTKSRTFLFLVQDADLCNTFCSFLTDVLKRLLNIQPKLLLQTETYLSQITKEIVHFYYPNTDSSDDLHKMELHLFALWSILDEIDFKPVCIVMTSEDIYLSTIQYKKGVKVGSNSALFNYNPLRTEKIENLIKIKLKIHLRYAEFYFLDEETNKCDTWVISTRTKSSLLSLLQAFKTPWEEKFQIELPIYYFKASHL